MGEQQSINQSEKKDRQPDEEISKEEFFESKSGGDYFKPEAGKEYQVGFSEAKYVKRDFGSGPKPVLVLIIDHLNGEELEEPQEFSTSAKSVAEAVEKYRDNEDINLFEYLFTIKKTGAGIHTKYSFDAHKKRPKAKAKA